MRRATLVVVGNLAQALAAVVEHRIYNASSLVEDPHGLQVKGEPGHLCRIVVDADRYNHVIERWQEETRNSTKPGTLLRVRWVADAA